MKMPWNQVVKEESEVRQAMKEEGVGPEEQRSVSSQLDLGHPYWVCWEGKTLWSMEGESDGAVYH